MPFTPLHMGLGLTIKAISPKRVSLLMFGVSQVVMDIQPLISMIMGNLELHGISHSIIGATFIGLVCLPFKKMLEKIFRQPISHASSLTGAFLGVYSHLLLDSIIHADVASKLFFPFQVRFDLYDLLTWNEMTILCLVLAVVGGVVLWWRGEVVGWLDRFNKN